jgi:hypothetical protein
MTIQELDNKFDKIIGSLKGNEIGDIMVKIGSDSLGLIRKRIQQTGIDSEGQKYRPYSTKRMLTNCGSLTTDGCQVIASSKAKRNELKWVTLQRGGRNIKLFELPQGYKQFRDIQGRQTNFVDFTFHYTDNMMSNIKVILDRNENNNGIVTIAATNPKEKIKLKGNADRRGPILKLSKSELSWINGQFANEIQKLINRQ